MARPRGGEAVAAVQQRLLDQLHGALRRKPAAEPKLAGALRAFAPVSPGFRDGLAEAGDVLVRRKSFGRPLYAAIVRALGEASHRRAGAILRDALSGVDAGGLCTVSAACFVADATLRSTLARASAARHAHTAFACEVARLARGEPTAAHLISIAPKIKEAHRIALCAELFVPLARTPVLPGAIAPALAVLRTAERHLGRWLVLAEVAVNAGDKQPLDEALERAQGGPSSSRAAWAFVAWALDASSPAPDVRPTAELIARLSDRPSSDRDTTFLFRLAASGAVCARAALEAIAKSRPLQDELSIRAAGALAKRYDRSDLVEPLRAAATDEKHEALRGLAVAALWDLGDRAEATLIAERLIDSRVLTCAVWAALVKYAACQAAAGGSGPGDVLDETRFRRLELGWVE